MESKKVLVFTITQKVRSAMVFGKMEKDAIGFLKTNSRIIRIINKINTNTNNEFISK